MYGTPTEVTVANALAQAMAEEQRARSEIEASDDELIEITCAALLRLRKDEQAAAFVKDVVFVDDDDPIPYDELSDPSDGQIVCVDLTDGGTVWCYDINGEPRWLPEEEFKRRAERIVADEDDDDTELALGTLVRTLLIVLAIGILLGLAFWFEVLPSGH